MKNENMFTRFESLKAKFLEYLKSEMAQMNMDAMDDGLQSLETLIAHVYNDTFPFAYKMKYSSDRGGVILSNESLEELNVSARPNRLKRLSIDDLGSFGDEVKPLQPIDEVGDKTFSFVDTCKKIGHYVSIGWPCSLVLMDYGIIAIYRYGKMHGVSKVTKVDVLLQDEDKKNEVETLLRECLVEIPTEKERKNVSVCTQGSYGITKNNIQIKPFDCDLSKNYNDDLPYERMMEIVNSDTQELMLLHGEPGTGKTSIIKKLMCDNPDVEFIYFDFNLLTSFGDAKIFNFLMEHTNHVLIIEDCEKLFTDRSVGNTYLNSMLNLTDGIIGEAFATKFICTFNCPPSSIDKAVLREGRLSLIYEFKKLDVDKVRHFIPTADKPMTLAEIYVNENNGKNKANERRIGF